MVNIKQILGKGILIDLIANKIPEIQKRHYCQFLRSVNVAFLLLYARKVGYRSNLGQHTTIAVA